MENITNKLKDTFYITYCNHLLLYCTYCSSAAILFLLISPHAWTNRPYCRIQGCKALFVTYTSSMCSTFLQDISKQSLNLSVVLQTQFSLCCDEGHPPLDGAETLKYNNQLCWVTRFAVKQHSKRLNLKKLRFSQIHSASQKGFSVLCPSFHHRNSL